MPPACIEMINPVKVKLIPPFGIGNSTDIGSTIDLGLLLLFLLGRGIGSIPASWQVNTGAPRNGNGSPSIGTDILPIKISPSLEGGFTKTPPMGKWGGVAFTVVPACALGMPLTIFDAPNIGTNSMGS